MISRTRLFTALAMIALSGASQPLWAQANACALLTPAAVSSLLGGATTAKPAGTGCSWSAGTKKLAAIVYASGGPPAAMMFAGARNAASHGGADAVVNESGLGEQAFSTLTSFGVALIMLKQGRILQLQYYSGAAGTDKDAAALRAVAKQAITAF
jgi:hypothetical protein